MRAASTDVELRVGRVLTRRASEAKSRVDNVSDLFISE